MILGHYDSPPTLQEAEVTLMGAGAYGESIVCHVGNNNWIIVDSCVNPNDSKVPLPLDYLTSLGVSPLNISLIICTHWHTDHIRGLSKILEAAPNAEFCISRAHDQNKFLSFVGMDSSKLLNSSTKEFTKCLSILKERGKLFIDAIEDRKIHGKGEELGHIFCLSPSDYTKQIFDLEIADLIKAFYHPTKKIPYSSPNSKSIVLFAKLGPHRAIFGADLETVENEHEGWLRVMKNKITIDNKSSLIKISHHGSVTGYHEDIWNILLLDNAVAKITPWKLGGNYLPKQEMIEKYSGHTNQLFITEVVESHKQKARDRDLEKLIKSFKPNLQEIKYKLGIIRSRINMNDAEAKWQVQIIMGAKKIGL